MNQWTILLAVTVVVAHSIAIFWPRKPLKESTDENGLPILWRNESDQSKDVACVWWGETEDAPPSKPTAQQESTLRVTAFSKAIDTVGTEAQASRRSVA